MTTEQQMSGGQLVQIYNLAKQQGMNFDKTEALLRSGALSDFFAGTWPMEKRPALRKLAEVLTPRQLIQEKGTFTGSVGVINVAHERGYLRKEGEVLHIDLRMFTEDEHQRSGSWGCVCSLTTHVETLEFLVRDLLKFFEVKEIVFYSRRQALISVVLEVEPGTTGYWGVLPGAYKNDSTCGTHVTIKGLGMRWNFAK